MPKVAYTLQKENGRWLSAHLFYAGSMDTFIQHAVIPFITNPLHREMVNQFFFVRFNEKGHHLRLRIRLSRSDSESSLKSLVHAHFKSYFDINLSSRKVDHPDWYPNDSVQFIDYVPEVHRYGGVALLPSAERQFYFSSRAVIDAMESQENWLYEDALGTAIKLHLCFVYASGMQLSQIIHFFEFLFESTAKWAFPFLKVTQELQMGSKLEKMKEIYDSNFLENQGEVSAYIKTFWQSLEQNTVLDESWLNSWLIRSREFAMVAASVMPDFLNVPDKGPGWSIYGSLVHMTNNRLGVKNHDESYICYLIMKSLQELGTGIRIH